jgi:hypothetical protein
MRIDEKFLYDLLPLLYRLQDEHQGGPLKELLGLIAGQADLIQENIDQLYDDLFIETCADWVIPYIGELIGVHGLPELKVDGAETQDRLKGNLNPRAQVANTLAYRRRKGTLSVLERIAHDVTGWDANVVEFFPRLVATQHIANVHADRIASVHLSSPPAAEDIGETSARLHGERTGRDIPPEMLGQPAIERLNSPFDLLPHTIDVRHIASNRGRYNLPNIGIFLWRVRACRLTGATPYALDPYRYLINPLGCNQQIFRKPEPESEITHLAGSENLPMPVRRREIYRLEQQNILDCFYGEKKSLEILLGGKRLPVNQITIRDLSDDSDTWGNLPAADDQKVAIDIELGRIAIPQKMADNLDGEKDKITVTYYSGFTSDLGGGEYPRKDTFEKEDESDLADVSTQVVTTKDDLINTLNKLQNSHGAVVISNSATFPIKGKWQVKAEGHIELRAADKCRPVLDLGGNEFSIQVGKNALISLNGLVITNGWLHLTGEQNQISIRHCTLIPGRGLNVDGSPKSPGQPSLVIKTLATRLIIDHCITGPLFINDDSHTVIHDSIIDSGNQQNVAFSGHSSVDGINAPGGELEINNATVIGLVHICKLKMASNTIFLAMLPDQKTGWLGPIWVERVQKGCVRFSYVPSSSQTPRRHRCQPESAAAGLLAGSITASNPISIARPVFSSLRYGDPGYCQLVPDNPPLICQGADDRAEMGAFHNLFQAQRQNNLSQRLVEYLRFGLEAGVFFAS